MLSRVFLVICRSARRRPAHRCQSYTAVPEGSRRDGCPLCCSLWCLALAFVATAGLAVVPEGFAVAAVSRRAVGHAKFTLGLRSFLVSCATAVQYRGVDRSWVDTTAGDEMSAAVSLTVRSSVAL